MVKKVRLEVSEEWPWSNDQTLFVKHLKFAFETMFERRENNQNLFCIVSEKVQKTFFA